MRNQLSSATWTDRTCYARHMRIGPQTYGTPRNIPSSSCLGHSRSPRQGFDESPLDAALAEAGLGAASHALLPETWPARVFPASGVGHSWKIRLVAYPPRPAIERSRPPACQDISLLPPPTPPWFLESDHSFAPCLWTLQALTSAAA